MDKKGEMKDTRKSFFHTDKLGVNVSRKVGRVIIAVLLLVGIGCVIFVGKDTQQIVQDSLIQDAKSNAEYTELKYREARDLADNYTEAVSYSKTSGLNAKHPEKYKSEVTGKDLSYANYRA